MNSAAPPAPRRISWLVVLLGLVAFAILIGLGTWQVQRLHWKEGLLATIEGRTHAAPRPLAEIEAIFETTGNVDYIPVVLSGVFHHAGERHFLSTWQGQSGFFVYTPLELADGRIVFVNRGFVPYDLKDPSKRPQGQLAGEVKVTGLARDPLVSKPSWVVPDNEPNKNVFYWKDRDGMARSAGLRTAADILPFFVDADATPNPGGLPIGGVTLIDMPNNHLQYAVTWYGLAAALVGVLAVAFWRSRKQARS
jgi:surfeit locus 1 family protein